MHSILLQPRRARYLSSAVRCQAGLASMRERAEELGGACRVVFRVGTGTTVVADLPLHDAAPEGSAS